MGEEENKNSGQKRERERERKDGGKKVEKRKGINKMLKKGERKTGGMVIK